MSPTEDMDDPLQEYTKSDARYRNRLMRLSDEAHPPVLRRRGWRHQRAGDKVRTALDKLTDRWVRSKVPKGQSSAEWPAPDAGVPRPRTLESCPHPGSSQPNR